MQDQDIALDEAIANDAQEYDPTRHLVNLNGRGDYLEVKWRILWLKKTHPDASIRTEFMNMIDCDLDRGPAIFRATISINDGKTVTTGWGTETAGDFRDFIEKAETKAIGRALAAAGFGTQFCQDHDFAANATQNVGTMRIVDAPVDMASTRGRRQTTDTRDQGRGDRGRANAPTPPSGDPAYQRATERQIKFIGAMAREASLDEMELTRWSEELYGQSDVGQLNRRDASALIEALQRRRNERA